jgi:hypothetical protein
MAEITVQTQEIENGWQFEVEIKEKDSKTKYQVTMDKDFYQRISAGRISPQDLVKKSFEFLLEREPKESILPKFNIKVISHYFPQYQKEIATRISS